MASMKRPSQQRAHPRMHPSHGNDDTVFATCNMIYHPTKGWRKIPRDTVPGSQKIGRLLSRLGQPISVLP